VAVFWKQGCIGYIPKDMVAELGLTPWANSDGEISEQVSSQWSRAWESTSDWIGVMTPTSHGSLPTQSGETRSVATGLAVVSGSQGSVALLLAGRIWLVTGQRARLL
jgi:hypothetical protein